jgi:hypothetical protein
MKSSQMIIVIVTKSSDIKVNNSTHENYTVDDKKITLTLNNFNNQHKFAVNMLFETNEVEFVEVVKVSYRYMVLIFNSRMLYQLEIVQILPIMMRIIN